MFMNWLARFGYKVLLTDEIRTAFINDSFIVIAFDDCITIERISGEEYYRLEYANKEFMNRVCAILDLR